MTSIAIHSYVCTCQRKGDLAVIEMSVVGVHTIVTGETVFAPGRQVGIGKLGVQPAVTVHTGRGIETS